MACDTAPRQFPVERAKLTMLVFIALLLLGIFLLLGGWVLVVGATGLIVLLLTEYWPVLLGAALLFIAWLVGPLT